MKTCSRCKIAKTTRHFGKRSSQPDGFDYYCRECSKIVNKQSRDRHIEKHRARAKRWREANPDRAKASHDAWVSRNRERVSATQKFVRLRSRYGLSKQAYIDLVNRTGNKCELCGSIKRLCIDHCHESNVVRGLLCLLCNTAIERLESVPDFSERAAAYLKKHSGG